MFRKMGQMDGQLEKVMLSATAFAGAESLKLQTKNEHVQTPNSLKSKSEQSFISSNNLDISSTVFSPLVTNYRIAGFTFAQLK